MASTSVQARCWPTPRPPGARRGVTSLLVSADGRRTMPYSSKHLSPHLASIVASLVLQLFHQLLVQPFALLDLLEASVVFGTRTHKQRYVCKIHMFDPLREQAHNKLLVLRQGVPVSSGSHAATGGSHLHLRRARRRCSIFAALLSLRYLYENLT